MSAGNGKYYELLHAIAQCSVKTLKVHKSPISEFSMFHKLFP